MGKPSNLSVAAAVPTPSYEGSSPRAQVETQTLPVLSRTPSANSVNTTHSQPPPPYVRPTPSSAIAPGRSNIASQLNASTSLTNPGTARPRRKWDLTLRILSVVVGVLGTVFFACALSKEDQVGSYDDGLGSMTDSLGIAMLASSTGVSSIMLITDLILLHQKKYPMHPAIPLTFDLLTWLAIITMTSMMCIFMEWTGSDHCEYIEPGEKCWASFVASMRKTGFAMMFFAFIPHFTISLMACSAVHRQRKEIKEMKATLRAYIEMS